MFKTLKNFSFAVLFAFSIVSAEPNQNLDQHRPYIAAVDPETYSFALSNNLVFQMKKKDWDIEPEVGIEVRFAPVMRGGESGFSDQKADDLLCLFAFNCRLKTVWLSEESKKYCLSYVASEPICTEPAGWISSAAYRDVIELSDGSKWIAVMEGPFSFKKGDRIILSKVDQITWGIIDIDQTIEQTGTDGKKYMHLLSVVVIPYTSADQKM